MVYIVTYNSTSILLCLILSHVLATVSCYVLYSLMFWPKCHAIFYTVICSGTSVLKCFIHSHLIQNVSCYDLLQCQSYSTCVKLYFVNCCVIILFISFCTHCTLQSYISCCFWVRHPVSWRGGVLGKKKCKFSSQ